MELITVQKFTSQKKLVAEYGLNKYALADLMRNNMHIATEFLPALTVYRMVHLGGAVISEMKDGQLVFPNWGLFNVIYHGCNHYNAKRAHELRLSFRAAQPEFDIEPIVLVQIVQENLK